jgi:hypothetical protein
MSCVFGLVALTAVLQAPSPVPPTPAPDSSAQLMAVALSHIKSQNLDSAAGLLQRVATAASRPVPVRVQAWVLLGVVEFYRSGDSAAAVALREALALDPNLQVPALETAYPDVAQLLAAERAALANRAPSVAPSVFSDSGDGASRVYDCLAKCPEGVRPPYFESFPRLEIMESSISGAASIRGRMRTFLSFTGVIDEHGILEQESLRLSGGTARGTESDLRRGLTQARFRPGRLNNAPVRTRVTLRFDFQAEGAGWVRYSYRVTAR